MNTATDNSDHIKASKRLRRLGDDLIQELRKDSDKEFTGERSPDHPVRGSAERTLALRAIQLFVMWLGMDLKAMFETQPKPQPISLAEKARLLYERYGNHAGWKNFQGNPMPTWGELPEDIKGHWIAVATPTDGLHEPTESDPYPNSKDPSNAVVDPTAGGMKL